MYLEYQYVVWVKKERTLVCIIQSFSKQCPQLTNLGDEKCPFKQIILYDIPIVTINGLLKAGVLSK